MSGEQLDKVVGNVKWFDNKKGFGIIEYMDKDVFIHHSNICVENNNIRSRLYENEQVKFNLEEDKVKNKFIALNLERIDSQVIRRTDNNKYENKDKYDKDRHNNRHRRPKNTENFNPSEAPPSMRVVVSNANSSANNFTSRDVILAPKDLFCDEDDLTIYNSLLEEMQKFDSDNENKNAGNLWKLWHGDTHHIADDHLNWKKDCPTFNSLLSKIEDHFNMKIKATRLNYYKDNSEWKPYHFDAAAVDPVKSKTQNFTVGISFGSERDIAFQIASRQREEERSVVSFPLKNGQCYAFTRDINTIWRHGVPQLKNKSQTAVEGRISVIAWGWVDQNEIN